MEDPTHGEETNDRSCLTACDLCLPIVAGWYADELAQSVCLPCDGLECRDVDREKGEGGVRVRVPQICCFLFVCGFFVAGFGGSTPQACRRLRMIKAVEVDSGLVFRAM